ncbi:hypothetical protein HNP55_000520 [Paucibacter oligotrophus]|uniref:YceI-like domain-containing protein n=1 Tax=Roseateles oligotrophus TaxID=1769250 RepID=A0A840L613_9BURK|nr:hypothetical protein [Roseateles oligotrophus]MBB4842025.1 hypothetical protein [Roseateles oligotrophus]
MLHRFHPHAFRALLLLALLSLAACSSPAPRPPVAEAREADPVSVLNKRYAELKAGQAGSHLYRLDAAASHLHIHVFRAGRAAGLGHNHVLSAPRLQGRIWLPAAALQGGAQALAPGQAEFLLRLDELQLDEPALRAALGPGWASTLSAEAVAATRANMLAGLQAQAYPWVRLRALRLVGEAPKLALEVEIELHGQSRRQWLAVEAGLEPDRLRLRGALVLRQTDFGLQPFSVGAGLLAVADELLLAFDLLARAEGG